LVLKKENQNFANEYISNRWSDGQIITCSSAKQKVWCSNPGQIISHNKRKQILIAKPLSISCLEISSVAELPLFVIFEVI